MTILSRWSSRCGGEPPRIWCHVLLLALVGLFILEPLGAHLKVTHRVLTLGFTAVLVLSIFVVGRTRVHVSIAAGLLLPAVFLRLGFGDDPRTPSGMASLVLGLLLLWFVAGTLASRIFRDRVITWETISGAVCVYLLMGFAWSTTFSICEARLGDGDCPLHLQGEECRDQVDNPHAFAGIVYGDKPGEQDAEGDARDSVRRQLNSFSFVTLTTLGYGDITPTHPITRMLATLEAIIGQLFLVIMVARLVALQVAASGTDGSRA